MCPHDRACAVVPVRRRGLAHRRTLCLNPQDALLNFEFRAVVAADAVEPLLIARLVVDTIKPSGDAPRQRQGDLRAEARRQMQRVLHRVATAAAEVERAEVGIDFFIVRDRRDDAVFEDFRGDHVLNADAHRVTCEPLGVGDNNAVCCRAEGIAQGDDFRCRAAAARGGERLVRHKDHLLRHAVAVESEAAFGGADDGFNDH